ncbi:hypothetical protein SHM_08880 [Spiroplasma ixodetis]|uniref:Uncharacterized protein n=1 Tax=Spiroplasma ixodetis TaxID=2141 RepID=A0ABN6T2A4_9MOLU|nr:hypothetical protein SHM_08880 [Spiroplasma ixodetis]
MQDIAVQFEKHCWIHSVSLFPPQVHVGRSPKNNSKIEELENTISNLNSELDSYSDDWMPLSLKENINRRIELQRKIDEENLTEEQKLEIFSNISKLKKK